MGSSTQSVSQIFLSYWRPPSLPTISHQVILLFALNLQQLISGYGIGFCAPVLDKLIKDGMLTGKEVDWFASSLVVGQLLGAVVGPLLADRIGRRTTSLLSGFCSLGGWIMLSTSQTGWLLLTARALTGFTDSVAVPAGIMYMSEVAETRLRGTFLNTASVASGLGIALAYMVGGSQSWRVASLLPPFLSCVAIPILVIMKESPVFLLTQQKEALPALQWYREWQAGENRSQTEKELLELESSLAGTKLSLGQTLAKLLDRENRRPFLILLSLFTLFPLTGNYNIAFFAIDLFKKLGLGSAHTVAVTSALVRVLGTVLSCGLIRRFGRRRLYIPSAAMSCVSVGSIGALVLVRDADIGLSDTMVSWLMVCLIFLFMFSIGVAVCTFPWIFMGEWFSADLKSLVSGTMVPVLFGFTFLSVQLTSTIISLLGTAGLFLYFSFICAVNTVFVILMVPETHGQMFNAVREKMTQPILECGDV